MLLKLCCRLAGAHKRKGEREIDVKWSCEKGIFVMGNTYCYR
jgi:hypothetical protein